MIMDHNRKPDSDPLPSANTSQPKKRTDVNPPIASASAHVVEQFRSLLAELISRQIIVERRGPPPGMAGE
jgi:hypothetical protein